MPTRCTATTAAGRACRAWAARGSDPPRCAAHRDRREDKGRPTPDDDLSAGDLSAKGLSDEALAAQIDDLDAWIEHLGAYIDAHRGKWAVGELCRLLDLYSKMLGRVTQMRQAQSALDGKQGVLMEATREVLKTIAKQKGIQLEPGDSLSLRSSE